MRIHLLHNYGGALTSGTRILPGTYAEDAPELHGLALYLVENGHATVVDGTVEDLQGYVVPRVGDDAIVYDQEFIEGRPVPLPAGAVVAPPVAVDTLDDLTVKELKVRADKLGVTYRPNSSKSELIAAIEAAHGGSDTLANLTLAQLKAEADSLNVAYPDDVSETELRARIEDSERE